MNIKIHTVAAVVLLTAGLGLGVLAVDAFANPTQPTPPSAIDSSWPPHPKNLFVWHGGTPSPLAPGQELVIATVPPDRWLVVNGADGLGSSNMRIYQRIGSGDKVRLTGDSVNHLHFQSGRGPVGVAFGPGSSVVIKNESLSSTLHLSSSSLIGYYTRLQ